MKLKYGAELDFISLQSTAANLDTGFSEFEILQLPFRTGWQIKQDCAANPVGGAVRCQASFMRKHWNSSWPAMAAHWTCSVVCFSYLHSSPPQDRQCAVTASSQGVHWGVFLHPQVTEHPKSTVAPLPDLYIGHRRMTWPVCSWSMLLALVKSKTLVRFCDISTLGSKLSFVLFSDNLFLLLFGKDIYIEIQS